jgi:DNA-binding NarL/FixJ family response regulator
MSTGPSLIRILAVDDHPMLREGIAALVASQSDMKLVGEASTGREALEQFRKHRPDLTLMDLQMPDMDGIEAMVAICSEFPEARIIVLTTYKGDVQVLRALKAGARAYLLKGLCGRNSSRRFAPYMLAKSAFLLRSPLNSPTTRSMTP